MAANYPGSIYSPRTKENKAGVVYDAAKTTVGYAEDVVKLDDEVVAIETELGTSPKATSASVKERLKGIRSLSDATEDTLVVKGGNVGIGTTEPLSKLSINGGLHVGGNSDAGDNNLLVDGDFSAVNLPAGKAYLAADQSVGAAGWVQVLFDTEEYDIGDIFDTETGEFTIPSTGVYSVLFACKFEGVADGVRLLTAVKKDDVDMIIAGWYSGGGSEYVNLFTIEFLEAGDVISAHAYTNDVSWAIGGAGVGVSNFAVVKIR